MQCMHRRIACMGVGTRTRRPRQSLRRMCLPRTRPRLPPHPPPCMHACMGLSMALHGLQSTPNPHAWGVRGPESPRGNRANRFGVVENPRLAPACVPAGRRTRRHAWDVPLLTNSTCMGATTSPPITSSILGQIGPSLVRWKALGASVAAVGSPRPGANPAQSCEAAKGVVWGVP